VTETELNSIRTTCSNADYSHQITSNSGQ